MESRSDKRIKRFMEYVGFPNSLSHYEAFKRFEMEIRQEGERVSDDDLPRGDSGVLDRLK